MLSASFCLSQNALHYSNFTKADGLPSNWVSCFALDNNGYLWVGTQNGLSRFDGLHFKNFYNEPFNPNSLSGNWVRNIVKDDAGQLWLGTVGGGLQRFDAEKQSFHTDYEMEGTIPKIVRDLQFADGKLWVSTEEGLLVSTSPYQTFKYITKQSFSNITILNQNDLLLSSGKGLWILNTATEALTQLGEGSFGSITALDASSFLSTKGENVIRYTLEQGKLLRKDDFPLDIETANTTLWGSAKVFSSSLGIFISSQEGIYQLDPYSKQLKPYVYFPDNTLGNTVLSYYVTEKGNLWIGTKNGVYTINRSAKTYEEANNGWQDINELRVRELQLDGSKLWLASENGLEVHGQQNTEKVLDDNITAFSKTDTNEVFAAGRGSNGASYLWHIDLTIDKMEAYELSGLGAKGVIWKVLPTSDRVWICGQYIFGYFDRNTKTLQFIPQIGPTSLQSLVVFDIAIEGNVLWLATLNGLAKVENQDFDQAFWYQKDAQTGLTNSIIVDLHQDRSGRLWLATESGLHLMEGSGTKFKHWGREEGLLDTKVLSLASDANDNIWLGTIAGGLFRFDPTRETFTNFNQRLGLPSDEFLLSASYSRGNQLFFGTEGTMVAFDASKLRMPPKDSLQLFVENMTVAKGAESQSLPTLSEIALDLPYNYGNLSIEMNTSNFYNPEETEYAYMVTGLYESWVSTGNNATFSLVNIPPGKYEVRLKAENPSFLPAERSFDLQIRRPFYQSIWAWLLYIALTMGVIYGYWRYRKNKLLVANRVLHLEEINRLKSKMYAEISHELKTPLTLIKGHTSSLSKKDVSKEQAKALNTIQQSSSDMLSLVNQMLDLAAIDAKSFKMERTACDLVALLQQTVSFFESQASSQEKQLSFSSSEKVLETLLDERSFKKVLYNLLSNAIKFTPAQGTIRVSLSLPEETQAQIIVSDTGMGISPEHLPKIFDRYYRTFDLENNLGSGIGMALTKELMQLMGGKITVKSQWQQGTTFTLTLPIEPTNTTIPQNGLLETAAATSSPEKTLNSQDGEGFQLVVVEDNEKLREYYAQLLDTTYQVVYFENGEEALVYLQNYGCDFVLSDAVMPKMDGYELCKNLKSNWTTSHIPFIMVSGLSDLEAKERGYAMGIDAFLVKPFETEELLAVISGLLRKQKQQADYYRKFIALEKETTQTVAPKDVEFMQTFRDLVLDAQNTYSAEELALAMGMSRTQLHRKVKTLTEMSTTDYSNHIRVETAKTLLAKHDLNISEIAYQVGFSDPGYFGKVFKKITKKTPQEWRDTLPNSPSIRG